MPRIKKCVTGQKFGRLTVTADYRDMERRKNVVDVVCDCGTRKTLKKSSVTAGRSQSCGCLRSELAKAQAAAIALDHAGKRFGRLVGIEKTGRKGRTNCWTWLYQCDCGAVVEKPAPFVQAGSVTSCGCRLTEARRLNVQHTRTAESIARRKLSRQHNKQRKEVARLARQTGLRSIMLCGIKNPLEP